MEGGGEVRHICRLWIDKRVISLYGPSMCFHVAYPRWGTADAEIKNPPPLPPGGSQGLSKLPPPLSKRCYSRSDYNLLCMLHLLTGLLPTYSVCLPDSFNFISFQFSTNFSDPQQWHVSSYILVSTPRLPSSVKKILDF